MITRNSNPAIADAHLSELGRRNSGLFATWTKRQPLSAPSAILI